MQNHPSTPLSFLISHRNFLFFFFLADRQIAQVADRSAGPATPATPALEDPAPVATRLSRPNQAWEKRHRQERALRQGPGPVPVRTCAKTRNPATLSLLGHRPAPPSSGRTLHIGLGGCHDRRRLSRLALPNEMLHYRRAGRVPSQRLKPTVVTPLPDGRDKCGKG